ncbi:hypothetical protein GLOIN_2v1784543 [Rhizophagus clarus]|uniref:Uncharacterized protein n=1 Tax=Rhizophagus clarus TaxID=94130 RepID=A0A8H3QD35_9GLOM|nr:hypothetical protein GLOIN_2v1784543 [Rhizophagus clarus]
MKLKTKVNKIQFNTSCELLNNPHIQPIKASKDIEIKSAISFYQNKSCVQNTEKATKNWLETFERFRKDMNKDGTECKALSIKQAIGGINRYLIEFSIIHGINLRDHHQFPVLARVLDGKMKDLQDKGLGEIKGSAALT